MTPRSATDTREPDGSTAAANDLGLLRRQIEHQRCVLVDAEHGGVFGQLALEHGQPALSEVAEPRVVRAALRIVIVRYHCDLQPQHAEQVKSLKPVRLSADLVDLVDRHSHESGNGSGG